MKKTIVDLVEEHGVVIKKEGTLLRGYCPFHNDTGRPNFTVYPETDSYYCFACGESGDCIQFVAKTQNISRVQAKQILEGYQIDLSELREKIDGLYVKDESLSFNTEVNVMVSEHCRKYLKQHPENASSVLAFLKQLDIQLLQSITYPKMQEILRVVKQTFVVS